MSDYVFTLTPPQYWDSLCLESDDLFNRVEWHNVLSRGFGCETIYGWDRENRSGMSITIFKAGPFRIGYIGFPVGGMLGKELINRHILNNLAHSKTLKGIDLLRIHGDVIEDVNVSMPSARVLETSIENLQQWDLHRYSKLRRVLNRVNRSSLTIVDAGDSGIGKLIYSIYKDTIARNKGKIRYTESYFCSLIERAKSIGALRCLLALSGNSIVGYHVVACHNMTAFYLHGGMQQQFKNLYPSDRLFYESILWARSRGMDSFKMMASPLEQTSLIRYKEKWGGVTTAQKIYELPLSPIKTFIFKRSASLYDSISGFMR